MTPQSPARTAAPQTLAQKLIAHASGRETVNAGEIVTCGVDLAMFHDSSGPRRLKEMLAELRVFCIGRNASIELLDVDAHPELRTRYGHRVPMLLLDGEPVCHARFDAAEVGRLLRSAPP